MINWIKIENFLKLKNIEFNLNLGNVLMGPSNFGKTTFLNLIKSIFDNDESNFINLNFLESTVIKFSVQYNYQNLEYQIIKNFEFQKIKIIPINDTEISFEEFRKTNQVIYIDYFFDNDKFLSIIKKLFIFQTNNDNEFIDGIKKKLSYLLSSFYDYNDPLCKEISEPKILNYVDNIFSIIDFGKNEDSILYKSPGFKKEFLIHFLIRFNFLFKSENSISTIILIDEIENSLNMDKVKELANLLYENKFQVITSSNNPFIIPQTYIFLSLDENFNSSEIYKGLLKNAVIVEGKTDFSLIGNQIFKDNVFSGGGKNIEILFQQLCNANYFLKILAIVDNDEAGNEYVLNLSKFLTENNFNDKYFIHQLKLGTIEDYYLKSFLIKKIDELKSKHLLPKAFNFNYSKGHLLEQLKKYLISKNKRLSILKDFKNILNDNNLLYFDKNLLIKELVDSGFKDFLKEEILI